MPLYDSSISMIEVRSEGMVNRETIERRYSIDIAVSLLVASLELTLVSRKDAARVPGATYIQPFQQLLDENKYFTYPLSAMLSMSRSKTV